MASSVSLEYLNSVLEKDTIYKGQFADDTALETAYLTASLADFAYVDSTSSFWYWNAGLDTPAWADQNITDTDYLSLSPAAQSMVPYIIVPSI